MEEETSHIESEGLKNFVRHLCLITKKQAEKEEAEMQLKSQIERVKRVSLKKPKQWVLNEELDNLYNKLSLVLEKERRLMGIGKEDNQLIRGLRNRIMDLEEQLGASERIRSVQSKESKEKIEELTKAIYDIRSNLNDYLETKTERDRRIKALENKVKQSVEKKDIDKIENELRIGKSLTSHELMLLELRVKEMEIRYQQLRKKRKYSQELRKLENKIVALRKDLEKKKELSTSP